MTQCKPTIRMKDIRFHEDFANVSFSLRFSNGQTTTLQLTQTFDSQAPNVRKIIESAHNSLMQEIVKLQESAHAEQIVWMNPPKR